MNIGWKLFRRRKDGTLGPLFINKRQVIEVGKTYRAEDVPTKGYARRPGWHLAPEPHAPHLSLRDRVWAKVEYGEHYLFIRPRHQGGHWIIANWIRVIEVQEALKEAA